MKIAKKVIRVMEILITQMARHYQNNLLYITIYKNKGKINTSTTRIIFNNSEVNESVNALLLSRRVLLDRCRAFGTSHIEPRFVSKKKEKEKKP